MPDLPFAGRGLHGPCCIKFKPRLRSKAWLAFVEWRAFRLHGRKLRVAWEYSEASCKSVCRFWCSKEQVKVNGLLTSKCF
jgi:hypothetical protein